VVQGRLPAGWGYGWDSIGPKKKQSYACRGLKGRGPISTWLFRKAGGTPLRPGTRFYGAKTPRGHMSSTAGKQRRRCHGPKAAAEGA